MEKIALYPESFDPVTHGRFNYKDFKKLSLNMGVK